MAIFSKDPTPQKPPTPSRSDAPGSGQSFLGPQIVFEGTISGEETLVVEGTVRGRIECRSDLRIGKQARVEAQVHARSITIEGTVIGDVSADQRVELVMTAHVDGNIKAPKIVVAEGAKFRGAVDMGNTKPAFDTETPKTKE